MTELERVANIMVLGQTGAGKSSFVNYLIGSPVSRTGVGMPVTQGFETYELRQAGQLPLRIFDSKGLEVMDYSTIRDDILQFLRERCSGDIYTWMHSIFYCINAKSNRLQPEETEFIRSLRGSLSQSVHVVLTHCGLENGMPDGASQRMAQYIRSEIGDERVRICFVNSVETRTRASSCPAYGREAVLSEIFALLWTDISRQVAGEYSRELYDGMIRIHNTACRGIDAAVGELCQLKTAQILSGNEFGLSEDTLARYQQEADAVLDELRGAYLRRIRGLADFCEAYGSRLGYNLLLLEPATLIPGFSLEFSDDDFGRTKLGRQSRQLESIPEDDFWATVGGIFQGIGGLMMWRQILRETAADLKRILRSRLPQQDEICRRVTDALVACLPPAEAAPMQIDGTGRQHLSGAGAAEGAEGE